MTHLTVYLTHLTNLYITLDTNTSKMPVHISPDIRSGVIRYWLKGYSRDEIASKFNISTGAVTNIVNEWRNNLGSLVADDLRELSLSLKKAQISPLECATGLRIGKMMQKFGINEEQFEYFMTEIYTKCQILEIAPEQIGEYLSETVNLSKIVFPSQIPNYINTKKTEIEQLEKQIEKRHEIISELNKEISNLEENQKSLIENNNISLDAIKWYKDIKEEFTNMGISFDDIGVFLECVRGIKKHGYDVNKVVTKFSELDYFDNKVDKQEEIIQKKFNEIEHLNAIIKNLEEKIYFNNLKISKNQELENIGMGLKELKTIYNTIIEIANENNIDPKEAIKKFFTDLNEFDDIVSFEKKAGELRNEVSYLSMQIASNRITLSSQQYMGTILQELLKIGITEKDIADINSILLLGGFQYYHNNDNNIIINKQSLISELSKYRSIKSVIKSMEQKQIQLTKNITELGSQKLVLENYINYLFILISNLKEIQLLLKKANIALEYPKILLIYFFSNSTKDDNNKDFKDNNFPKKT
jgi:hypothetical protein